VFVLELGLPKPAPAAQRFYPNSAAVGTPIRIWGNNLLGASVEFNGVAATEVTNSGPNYVWATVPAGSHKRADHHHDARRHGHHQGQFYGRVVSPSVRKLLSPSIRPAARKNQEKGSRPLRGLLILYAALAPVERNRFHAHLSIQLENAAPPRWPGSSRLATGTFTGPPLRAGRERAGPQAWGQRHGLQAHAGRRADHTVQLRQQQQQPVRVLAPSGTGAGERRELIRDDQSTRG
jgi:hypothetical protein